MSASPDLTLMITAGPRPFGLQLRRCALLVIDMQRDFLEPGGFGEALGNDVRQLRRAIGPTANLLREWRRHRLPVVHTREGHRPDLSDLLPTKRNRPRGGPRIGELGPMGRILVQGEPGHAIVPELAPTAEEVTIDKPGKGAFWRTELEQVLRSRGIEQLLVTGVTTEICVSSTVREANDRGFDCLVLSDCTASYFPEFHTATLAMMTAQDAILAWVTDSVSVLHPLYSL